MVHDNFQSELGLILEFEGGYSDDPDDHGGRTMCGITQREYDIYRERAGSAKQTVADMSPEERDSIYEQSYWDAVRGDELPSGLDLCMFDYAVNSGPTRAILTLQKIIGVPATGTLSTSCLNALNTHVLEDVVSAYQKSRADFLTRIGTGDQRKFLKGWLYRVGRVTEAVMVMVCNNDEPQLSPGASGGLVRRLQQRLHACGYPVGNVDGRYGGQTRRSVILWQHEMGFDHDEPGVWKVNYWEHLVDTKHLNPERRGATSDELVASGNRHMSLLFMMRRLLTFVGLGGATAGTFPDLLTSIRTSLEPVSALVSWADGRKWIFVTTGAIVFIVIVELLIAGYTSAYRRNGVQ
jgi:lysozyme family protein